MVWLIVSAILLALIGLYLFLIAPGRPQKGSDYALWHMHYAHRGLYTKDGVVPENSLAAFDAAVKAGYGIELDVHITADDHIIVFHDDVLSRLCGTPKKVRELTYAQLNECRLLNTDQRIPLFSDVLTLVGGRVPLIVEIKNGKKNKTLCEKTAALLDDYTGAYCIESFNPMIVGWFRKNRSHVVRGQLAAGRRQYQGRSFWQGLLLSGLLVNAVSRPHFVAYRHEDARGKLSLWFTRLIRAKLVGWTVREQKDVAFCTRFFDAIIFEFIKPHITEKGTDV